MSNYEINILHLYPDLLNLYGDKGNINAMKKRLEWRGISVNVKECTADNPEFNINDYDILFLGGGSDKEQEVVCEALKKKEKDFINYAEDNGVIVGLCGGYQMLGKYYKTSTGQVDGIGVLDIYCDIKEKRLIGNVILESELVSSPIVGFENHGGRMVIGDNKPLGKVVCGFGNDGESGYEGVVYKNVFATYLHGPVFPKNPQFCDLVLSAALKKKYPDFQELEKLDDSLENQANEFMVNKIQGE